MKNKEIVIDTRLNTILFDNTKYYDVPKEILSYIEQLENNRDKAIEILGQYKHYSTPTEEQNSENEDIVDNAYNILKGDSE